MSNRRLRPLRARVAGLLAAAAAVTFSSCRDRELPIADPHARELAAGQRIFERKCASCHNTNGDGKTITAGRFRYANLIDGIWRSDGSAAAIEKQIREGHDPMPRFQGKLTDEEIRQTVAWVLELDRRAAAARSEAKGKEGRR